ncbi:hypothetical protein SAMN04487764_2954 [Gillisia sp. Hel1_33_143]|uniref:guanitoxin biosynthesis heme-dependent pre-guanitoxin N-hydroxylase GntA n=1 Tax=Gillisia sp. Hel1_33_143 TaxID=1336796 RepID=UPI00087AE698|nr:guanitoxin biosynthesis heme-dependent pre-guanitoxin N-hydroxylase GntA [Gillisia sp. Hel1_33_143]SDS74631.1 hypothetical protein SAMN04487764_2954 [Gillisia sp. Hel1_33_143]
MQRNIKQEYEDWIVGKDHPCVMAQTVFSQDTVKTIEYYNFNSETTTKSLLEDLESYINDYDFESNQFQSLVAVFPDLTVESEKEFELLLWEQLYNIEKIDNQPWDSSVSRDPNDDNFSFSIAGHAFYIVGMHPNSSRLARQSPYPSIAFNLHNQFEKLREMGAYEKVRDKIRERDMELQGSVNPMLEDFGESSEAKQYSGRAVGGDWVCPFHQ